MFPPLSKSSSLPTLPFHDCLMKRVSGDKDDNPCNLVLVRVNFTEKIGESQEGKREYNLLFAK